MHVPWWFPFGRVEEIAPHDLKARLSNGADLQLLDVRTALEYREGHIAGAQNVPIADLPRYLDSLGFDQTRPVVAICLSGHRSVPAYRLLKSAGFCQVVSLQGGMLAWWRANLPTSKNGAK